MKSLKLQDTSIKLKAIQECDYIAECRASLQEILDHCSNVRHAWDQIKGIFLDAGQGELWYKPKLLNEFPNILNRTQSLHTKIDEESKRLTALKANLTTVSTNLNSMIEKSTKFCIVFKPKDCVVFVENDKIDVKQIISFQKFYKNPIEKIEKYVKDFDNMRSMLGTKIEYMEKLKIQANQTDEYVSREIFEQRQKDDINTTFNTIKHLGQLLVYVGANILIESINKLNEQTIFDALTEIGSSLRNWMNIIPFPF